MEKLVIATHNAGKLREIGALLAPFGVACISAGELGLPEPEEDAPDFIGNARIKALAAARASGLPALADDSGLSVAALGGAPGIYSARWAGPTKDFTLAMEKVWRAALASGERPPYRAHFTCALCLAQPNGEVQDFLGEVHGELIWPPLGRNGFGYDAMFRADSQTLSFGQMDPAAKHAISHRAIAFAQFVAKVFHGERT